jgi:hypothetical protein
MATYLFVTKPEYSPDEVEDSKEPYRWSCSRKTRSGDRALVYVTGSGIAFEWDVVSDAEPNSTWRYMCDVEHVETFHPPITIQEIRGTVAETEWSPPHQNFRGFRSIIIPEEIAKRIRNLREKRRRN